MPTESRYFDERFFYHVYNCGVEKRNIFIESSDILHFVKTANYYQHDHNICFTDYERLDSESRKIYLKRNPQSSDSLRVKIIAYCLMPNHFHFLIRPNREDGISLFISELSNSYTRYFNLKNERIGHLFQGTFKSKEIRSEESLLQVSRYIHLNPYNSSKTNPKGELNFGEYPYFSYFSWINNAPHPTGVKLDNNELKRWLEVVGGRKVYKSFVESMIWKRVDLEIGFLALE